MIEHRQRRLVQTTRLILSPLFIDDKSTKSIDAETSKLPYELQFWLLLVFGVLSLLCSLMIIREYLCNKNKRRALHNHAILLIIIINVILIATDFSWMLDSLRRPGQILSATSTFCLFWLFFDYALYTGQTVILAWASIERHILIFRSSIMKNRSKQILYHYLPLSLLIIYVVIFYVVVIVFPPCENQFDYTIVECNSNPCYLRVASLVLWDTIVNSIIPTLIIVVFSISLLCRILIHRRRLHRSIQWRKHRQMSLELLTFSAVYTFLNLPFTVMTIVDSMSPSGITLDFLAQLYFFFLTYGVSLSMPFVVFLRYFSHRGHRRRPFLLCFGRHRRIQPSTVATIE
jgi:hypothetical protein